MATVIKITTARYGAPYPSGVQNAGTVSSFNVTAIVQKLVDVNPMVTINNTTMGGDPIAGPGKGFFASGTLNGAKHNWVCTENETINFAAAPV